MWFALIAAAWADTLQLDNGAVLVGRLAAYDRDGECRIEIAQGDLSGTAVVVDCSRIARFERSLPPPLPAIVPEPEPEPEPEPAIALAAAPAPEPLPAPAPAPVVLVGPASVPAEPPLAVPAAESDIPVEIVDHPTEIPEDVEVPVDAVSEREPPPSDEPPARKRWYEELPTFSDPFRK